MSFYKIFTHYLVLILITFLFDCFFSKISKSIIFNLIENILFAIILIFPLYILDNQKLKKYYLIFSYIFFSLSIFLETAFHYLFKTILTASAIFIALDTNSEETKEFIGFYIDMPIMVLAVIILIASSIILIKLKKEAFQFQPIKKKFSLIVIVLILFLKFSGLIIYNLPYMVIRSAVGYYIESKKLGDYATNKTGNFTNVQRSKDIEEEVYVVIIGESTARSHLGLYNYYRNTTPLLNELKDELLVYKKVISPDTYTIASLTSVLTLGNYENPEGKYNGSIIQLLNEVGFKTYWISAQKPLGANDSYVTKIGMGADESYFLNIKNAKEETLHDEVLVEKMNEVLENKAKKKVIFLHTLGTHMGYKNRYPKSFDFYKTKPKSKFEDENIFNQINAYDNAVRYTDFIINSVIESVKNRNTNSFVLYFSDHGEEVFDDIEFSGHFRNKLLTKNVFEIPLILWQSESYKKNKNIYSNESSKYMIDDLFHAMADLFYIKADEVDTTRSIFNKSFKERRRIIYDTLDYDNYFK